MAAFDLEKAKNGAELVTFDNRPAKIIYWNKKGKYPLVVLIDYGDNEIIKSCDINGNFNTNGSAIFGKGYLEIKD